MDIPKDENMLDSKEVSKLTGLSLFTLERYRSEGKGQGPPYYKPGGKAVRYRYNEVMAWLNSSHVGVKGDKDNA